MDFGKFWKERGSTITSGIAALVIIIVGFLLFNTSTQNTQKGDEAKKEAIQEEQKKSEEAKKKEEQGKKVYYTVKRGDYLSAIARRFYSDGSKWTLIAEANKLANPQIIHAGNVLSIPEAGTVSSASTNNQGAPSTYTVTKGDSLWTISERYLGTGFSWYKIRDANPGKVGLLKNGRPLITPGTVLKIPAT